MTLPSSHPSTPAKPGKRLRMDAQRNRDAIMAAARDLIASQGLEVSMEAIAATAGVGIGTLYRHFTDRDALIRAVAFDRLDYLAALAADALAAFEDAPRQTWDSFFDDFLTSGLPMLMPTIIQIVLEGNVFDDTLFAVRDTVIASLSEVIDLAKAHGFVRTDIALPEIVLLAGGALRPIPGVPEAAHSQLVERRRPLLRAAIAPSGEALPGEPITPERLFRLLDAPKGSVPSIAEFKRGQG